MIALALAVLALTGLASAAVTLLVCRNAERLDLVQAPNHRSSHIQPTPQSGGIGIAFGGSLAGVWLAQGGLTGARWSESWLVLGLALVLALVGLWDDLRPLRARVRFAVQVLLCAVLVWQLGELPQLSFLPGSGSGQAGRWATGVPWLSVLLVLVGVWWINLFNFMDGIDGIAGSQAVFMLSAAALLGFLFAPPAAFAGGSPVLNWMLAIVAATLGFLVFNWPPARIFMGDVGSTWLAFMIFALALLSVRQGWMNYPAWLVLGAVFICDTTVTLMRRMLRGERWFEAHRSHAYQRLARRLGAHRPATLTAITVNVLWLAPLAAACLVWPRLSWEITLFAYGPVIAGVLASGAGRSEPDRTPASR